MMFLNKVVLTVLVLGALATPSLFAAGDSHGGLSEQQEAPAELAIESSEQWVERMAQEYNTLEMNGFERDHTLTALRSSRGDSQEWVERIAQEYITLEMNGFERNHILTALTSTRGDSQEWVERMARTYIMAEIDAFNSSFILNALRNTPVDSQGWFEQMARTYITAEVVGSARSSILSTLSETPVDSHEWVERIAQEYITLEMNGTQRVDILGGLNQTPVEAQEWFEHLVTFLEGRIYRSDIASMIGHLNVLSWPLNTPALLEQGRIRFVERVNQALEDGPLTLYILGHITTLVRDEVTQEARINPNAGRPVGRAFEVHFASALEVPLEEGGRGVPLYKAVESQLCKLVKKEEMKLVNAVSLVNEWVHKYADEDHKDLYLGVVSKGYGDGSNPGYNQEITPLLRLLVPYMRTLDPTVQSAWLLPALQESARAYNEGDPVSCTKGIQERLTVVGLDVEGVDPVLRSLSKFARDFLYITDPTTNGADTWVKTAVSHLPPEERASLLGNEKPQKDAFKVMFQRGLAIGMQEASLLPLYTHALLKDKRIQECFKNSLEMHYEYDHHYEALKTKAREISSPQERRELVARAAEKRLPKSATPPEEDSL